MAAVPHASPPVAFGRQRPDRGIMETYALAAMTRCPHQQHRSRSTRTISPRDYTLFRLGHEIGLLPENNAEGLGCGG